MEFDENEDEQDEEIENQVQPNYETPPPPPLGRGPLRKGSGGGGGGSFRYRECLKNHAVGIGGHAVDGCGEFLPSGEEGSLDALICAACNCHRNFHRKESTGQPSPHHHHHQQHHHSHQQQQLSPFYHRTGSHPPGYGLHHVATAPPPPLNQRPLALPSLSRDEEDMSNPSSSGGGGGGGGGGGSSRKRFRTRFTQEQKDKMLEFAERVGWRIQKQDEVAVEQFCGEIGVRRQVLKVWMHNNKHTLGKKP